MTEHCIVPDCAAPVAAHFSGGPYHGAWCWEHAPKSAMVSYGVSRYESFGRAAEPILREIQAMQQTRMVEGGNAAAIRAALALLDGRETE